MDTGYVVIEESLDMLLVQVEFVATFWEGEYDCPCSCLPRSPPCLAVDNLLRRGLLRKSGGLECFSELVVGCTDSVRAMVGGNVRKDLGEFHEVILEYSSPLLSREHGVETS